jgi:hypothetical protein
MEKDIPEQVLYNIEGIALPLQTYLSYMKYKRSITITKIITSSGPLLLQDKASKSISDIWYRRFMITVAYKSML